MSDALLSSQSSGSGGTPVTWDHLGPYYNKTSSLAITDITASEMNKYVIILPKFSLLKTLSGGNMIYFRLFGLTIASQNPSIGYFSPFTLDVMPIYRSGKFSSPSTLNTFWGYFVTQDTLWYDSFSSTLAFSVWRQGVSNSILITGEPNQISAEFYCLNIPF